MNFEKKIAQKLLQINAIKLNTQNPFTWASGIKSPIYCDNRLSLSHPEVRRTVKEGLVALSTQFDDIHHVSGVATAGIAHGALLADALDLPFSYVRSSAKKHGRQNQIEGDIAPNSNILVVEDLISTGGSSLEAVEVLREAGHTVVGVVAIFSYGFEKAATAFQQAECPYATLSSYPVLLEQALASAYITADEARILSSWNADPASWYSNNF